MALQGDSACEQMKMVSGLLGATAGVASLVWRLRIVSVSVSRPNELNGGGLLDDHSTTHLFLYTRKVAEAIGAISYTHWRHIVQQEA